MAALVTLTQAKTHLGETSTSRDTLIQAKLDAAEEMVLAFIKHRDISGRRKTVVAAILVQMTELVDFRGDVEAPATTRTGISQHAANILGDLREPTIA